MTGVLNKMRYLGTAILIGRNMWKLELYCHKPKNFERLGGGLKHPSLEPSDQT